MARIGQYVPPEQVVELRPEQVFEGIKPSDILDVPPVLYCSGDIGLLLGTKRVAVVGTRNPTESAIRRAEKVARQLAQAGVVVVSGLAKGIDDAAHRAAIAAGGRTIAVIGTPIDKCYPAEHAALQMEIYRHHLLASQFPVGNRVFQSNFLSRNKVMARIAHASIVVEAGATSGSLSQAREVLALGRPLFLMRSLVEDSAVAWPAVFIANGAMILDRTEQVLEAIA